MKSTVIASLVFLGTFLAAPLSAHHEFLFESTFDGQPVNVTGKVVKVIFANPHVHIEIAAVDSNNNTVHWVLEGASISRVRSNGLDKDTLKNGDMITACGFPGKGNAGEALGVKVLSAERITIPNGKKLALMEFSEKFKPVVSKHCE